MVFILAKFWGTLPHLVWHYPFRYYMELRAFYLASLTPPVPKSEEETFDFDSEMFRGDSV
jgi:hypothetical protein